MLETGKTIVNLAKITIQIIIDKIPPSIGGQLYLPLIHHNRRTTAAVRQQ